MQRRTPVFIVTSSRPRVGKTLRRARADRILLRRSTAGRGFRRQSGRIHSWSTTCRPIPPPPASTTRAARWRCSTSSLLEDEVPKVVDLGHLPFERFFSVMQQIGFATEAAAPRDRADGAVPRRSATSARGRATPCCLTAFQIAAGAGAQRIRAAGRARYRAAFPADAAGRGADRHSGADAVVRSVVERPSFSFISYVQKTNDTTSELFDWMRRVFLSFRELEVRLLLGEITPQLRYSA